MLCEGFDHSIPTFDRLMESPTPAYLVQKLRHLRRHVSLGPHDTSALETWHQLIPPHFLPVFSHLVDSKDDRGSVAVRGKYQMGIFTLSCMHPENVPTGTDETVCEYV